MPSSERLILATRSLVRSLKKLVFAAPVAHVYNPLEYAWSPHELYLRTYGNGSKRVLFLGMNPGPFGMVQTGIPFGEVQAVKNWLKLSSTVQPPPRQHPARPIWGFDCARSEVSGQRLWGLFASRYPDPAEFFAHHFVVNYCPLAFLEASGRNRTPDKLPTHERQQLYGYCDSYLQALVEVLQPAWVVGVGNFAAERASEALAGTRVQIGRILHPSPASPSANRDWAGEATRQLIALNLWRAAKP